MENTLKIFEVVSEKEGITIGALERAIGASKGVLSRAINNGTDVQSKWLVSLIEKYPNYDYKNMLMGKFSTSEFRPEFHVAEESSLQHYEKKDTNKQIEDVAYGINRRFDDVERALKILMLDISEVKLKADAVDPEKITKALVDLGELKGKV